MWSWILKNRALVFFFIVTIALNYFYGSLVYSKMLGKEEAYNVGKLCAVSRTDCEHAYFQDYLNKIDSLSNESRDFFSEIIIMGDRRYYTGNCPCPYDNDSAGNNCGGRSSYSKNGQISYCYDSDVPDSLVAQKKASMITKETDNLNNAIQKDLDVYNEKYTLLLIIGFYGMLAYFRSKKL